MSKQEFYEQIASQPEKILVRDASFRAFFFLTIFLTFDYVTKRNIFSETYDGSALETTVQLVTWYVLIVLIAYMFGRLERRKAAKKLEELKNDQ